MLKISVRVYRNFFLDRGETGIIRAHNEYPRWPPSP